MMETYITWQNFKEKVESTLEANKLGHDTPIYKIDLHEDRDDGELGAFINDGMLEVLC